MNKKSSIALLSVILLTFYFLPASSSSALQDTAAYISPFAAENELCFVCHGQPKYEYANEFLGTQVKAQMCEERIVRREEFYNSNHKSFACTDCHSADYITFPHPGELRMELKYGCIDCHGGDDQYSMFNFETIDIEYQESAHYELESEGFTCWSCHDPHTYKINIRNTSNFKETVLYDNSICLDCHSDFTRYQILSEKEEVKVIDSHEWLPNQASHFSSVRCIECHTRINDTILVAHHIVPKEEAVRKCSECHSQNSILMASLYKFQSKESRKDGFLNGIIMNESYVIGANRNKYLNILSAVIFAITLVVVGIHIVFRIIKKP